MQIIYRLGTTFSLPKPETSLPSIQIEVAAGALTAKVKNV